MKDYNNYYRKEFKNDKIIMKDWFTGGKVSAVIESGKSKADIWIVKPFQAKAIL